MSGFSHHHMRKNYLSATSTSSCASACHDSRQPPNECVPVRKDGKAKKATTPNSSRCASSGKKPLAFGRSSPFLSLQRPPIAHRADEDSAFICSPESGTEPWPTHEAGVTLSPNEPVLLHQHLLHSHLAGTPPTTSLPLQCEEYSLCIGSALRRVRLLKCKVHVPRYVYLR